MYMDVAGIPRCPICASEGGWQFNDNGLVGLQWPDLGSLLSPHIGNLPLALLITLSKLSLVLSLRILSPSLAELRP